MIEEDAERLRQGIRAALELMVNPYDGGEYETGEMPAADILRAALAVYDRRLAQRGDPRLTAGYKPTSPRREML